MIRAVIFDYGHTLVDFVYAEDLLLEVYTEVRTMLADRVAHDVPEAAGLVRDLSRQVERSVMDSYMHRQLEELDIEQAFSRTLESLGVKVSNSDIRTIVEMEHRALMSEQRVDPGILRVLRELKENKLLLGLVSNAHFLPAMMRQDAERLGIAEFLDASVYSAEIGVRKPHRAIFEFMLRSLNVAPEDTVFVGDRLYDDVLGAQALGMRGVLTRQYRRESVEGHPIRPDKVVDTLEELPAYIRSLQHSD